MKLSHLPPSSYPGSACEAGNKCSLLTSLDGRPRISLPCGNSGLLGKFWFISQENQRRPAA